MVLENSVGYLIDDLYLLHEPGNRHPESPQRLMAIRTALESYKNLHLWQKVEPRLAHIDELQLIHHPGYLERVEKAAQRAPAYLDPDTVVSSESYRTGLFAAGGVLKCSEAVCGGTLRRVFAFVRPPGHHAEPDKAMGFCLFNNVALAATWARINYKLDRVAIVDIDLHHGNGTQEVFYDDPHVLYISTHQFPFYPGTGDFDEVGVKEGKGYTINFPLPAGTGDDVFVPLYCRVVEPILEQYRPQLILVSTGFDAYFKDPLGGLAVTRKGYAAVAAALIRAAEKTCDGKICFVLEGGYSIEGLQECTKSVMMEMESESLPGSLPLENPLYDQISQEAKKYLGSQWKW